MSNSIQQCVVPMYYNQPEKSNTGKKLGVLAGIGTTAYGLIEGDTFQTFKQEVSSALKSYNDPMSKGLKSLMPKKDFVKSAIKANRIQRYGEIAAAGVIFVTAGLAAGMIIDKAVDAFKNHKAKKAQKAFEEKYMQV